MSADANELLDAFKAAALSVTKLYKTSASAQAKSRADGYQDCLEDLLLFLDKEHIGVRGDGEAHKIRKWVSDRIEGRDGTSPPLESEDEADKTEAPTSSPQIQRSVPAVASLQRHHNEIQMRDSSAPPILTAIPSSSPARAAAPPPPVEEIDIVVPSQDTFNFQSAHPYPHDEAMRLANLDLSDSTTHASSSPATTTARSTPRSRNRHARPNRTALGRGAGQKRKVDLAEIFGLGSLDYGNGKDMFGGGKRGRFI